MSKLVPFKKNEVPDEHLKVCCPQRKRSSTVSETSTQASFVQGETTTFELEKEGVVQRVGSLQRFVKSSGPIEDYSPDLFSADEVHKIAVLDLRILNLDRNGCNILVR